MNGNDFMSWMLRPVTVINSMPSLNMPCSGERNIQLIKSFPFIIAPCLKNTRTTCASHVSKITSQTISTVTNYAFPLPKKLQFVTALGIIS